ncbi:MAG: secretin N-terminal domain-containing protein, partial [Rubripirellula sp.]
EVGDSVMGANVVPTRLVIQNESTRAPIPAEAATDAVVQSASDDDREFPPVFLVPGQSRITITSEDEKALDRLESILRAMAVNVNPGTGQSNFAVFLLKNMGASDTKLLLDQLFEDLNQRGLNDLVFVADERLNALIIHGSRHAREVIQELLETLDNAELPDPLDVYRPELIALEHAEASRVIEILKNVYKTQLTSGGGRTPISIPKGVSSSVASLLQQINAASAGPVLALDVDETSNSLIVRAPPELRLEISEFVGTIDVQASTNSNRHVKVIRLSRTKSDRMQEVLQRFLVQPGSVSSSSKVSSKK